MNVADSEAFSTAFESAGYKPVEEQSEADIILVNTCTVRHHAEERALSAIGHLKKWKGQDPKNRVLILAGCVASRLGESLKKRFPQVDLVVGAEEVEAFPEILEEFGKKHRHEIASGASPLRNDRLDGIASPSARNDLGVKRITAFVPIMRGCNNFCSYCIVPYVRGREKSRPPAKIIKEIKRLAKEGVKEVTLLGQNVNSYRYEIASPPEVDRNDVDFADLLAMVNDIDGINRIRFMTSHPKDLSGKLIKTIAKLDKLCPHVHLPLQSGSNRVLKLMNRGYTRERYIKLVQNIRRNIPGAAVTTDLLVGFPSETDKDFKDTLDAVKKCRFDFAYVFKYSRREKTKASEMPNEVPEEIISKRHARLLKLCNHLSEQSIKKFKGKTVEVLVESVNENGELWGKTPDNRAVYIKRDEIASAVSHLIGSVINANISGVKIHSLSGIISEKCRQKPLKKKTL